MYIYAHSPVRINVRPRAPRVSRRIDELFNRCAAGAMKSAIGVACLLAEKT